MNFHFVNTKVSLSCTARLSLTQHKMDNSSDSQQTVLTRVVLSWTWPDFDFPNSLGDFDFLQLSPNVFISGMRTPHSQLNLLPGVPCHGRLCGYTVASVTLRSVQSWRAVGDTSRPGSRSRRVWAPCLLTRTCTGIVIEEGSGDICSPNLWGGEGGHALQSDGWIGLTGELVDSQSERLLSQAATMDGSLCVCLSSSSLLSLSFFFLIFMTLVIKDWM